jgi:signal transduction histidine kinase/streptogramin lyase
LLVLGAIASFASVALAATPTPDRRTKAQAKYSVDRWSVDQGLLYDNVGSVLEGQDGYLWIGTDGGVQRFDGMNFVVYRMGKVPGLVGDSVRSMLQDSSGAIWIGTNRGLSRYANGKFETLLESKTTDYVYALCEDAKHTIWIGTQNGLFQYRNQALTPAIADAHLAGKSILSLFCDSHGRVWIGVSNLAAVVCYENGVFRIVANPAIATQVMAVAETAGDVLWFGTNSSSLVRYDVAADTFRTFGAADGLAGKSVTALYTDPAGTLWIGTLGLHRFDAETDRIESVVPMTVPSIRRICHDREGSIWACSYGDGLMRVRPARFKILNRDGGLPGDFVRTVMQDVTGAMWLAQSGQGGVKIAPDGTVTRLLRGDVDEQGDDTLAVWSTRSGETLIGANRGLYVRRGETVRRYPEFRGTRAIFEDTQGTVWIGAYEVGLTSYRDGAFARVELPVSVAKCTPCAFAEDTDHTLYAGTTTQGVLALRGKEVTLINATNGLPSDDVRAVYLDRDRNLWIGTKRGLAVRIGAQWYAPAWLRDIVDEHVSGMVEIPNDYMLFSTTHGVVRFSRAALLEALRNGDAPKYLPQVTIVEAGRTGSIGASCAPGLWTTSSGEVWIAARKGVVIIDPRRIAADTVPPAVQVEQLTADGKVFGHEAHIALAAGARQLTVEYSAITFVQPNRVFFKYQLEGYEDAPVDAGTRRVAFYNNLPPGHYVFHVRACNSDGVWNERGSELAFTVLPFFYQTWWFRTAVVLAAVGAVLGVIRWRVRQVQRHAEGLQAQNAELERRIAERTAELAKSLEQLKSAQRDLLESSRLAGMAEVASGVLHNIGNALNSVNVSADVARNRLKQMKVASIQRVAQLLTEQGDRLGDFIAKDPRGRRLPEFLLQMSEHLSTECAMTAQELDALCGGVEHIKTVVAAQQDLTHATEVLESVPPTELVEAALRISAAALHRHHVVAVRDYQPAPPVNVPRQRTLQILINLINNAKESMDQTPPTERQLSIGVRSRDEAAVEIVVADNGGGIAPENLERIFHFGFTTKKEGHGFGLHSSVLTAKEMGGELKAFSDGVGRGATFILRLPIAPSGTAPASLAGKSATTA